MLKTEARLISARVTRAKTVPPPVFRKVTHSRRGPLFTLRHCTSNSGPFFRSRSLRSALSTSTSAVVTPFRLAPGFPPLVERKTDSRGRERSLFQPDVTACVCACVSARVLRRSASRAYTSLTSTSTSTALRNDHDVTGSTLRFHVRACAG